MSPEVLPQAGHLSLEINNVDPIRYGLLFERFLNPERVNPPDIDIDFADDRRADVIEYTREKYGRECVAQIGTFGTMGAKSVIRDVGRVMGLSYGEVDRLAKMVPNDLKITLAKSIEKSPDLKTAYESKVTRELIDTAFILEDVTRNCSVHAAGVVIGAEPLQRPSPQAGRTWRARHPVCHESCGRSRIAQNGFLGSEDPLGNS